MCTPLQLRHRSYMLQPQRQPHYHSNALCLPCQERNTKGLRQEMDT